MLGIERFVEFFLPTFLALAKDELVVVREHIAIGFHEVKDKNL
jgi:hypothetical protein